MKKTIATAWLAAAAIAAAPGLGMATPQATLAGAITAQVAQPSAEDLERAFWLCDYVASTHGMQFVSMDLCAAVTDLIKTEKFDGDYEEMVRWWREQKPAQHLRLRLEEDQR
jgi:hypothetical protein